MGQHVRKYVLMLLVLLTALLCSAGASTWIVLSEKTVNTPAPFAPVATTVGGTLTATEIYSGQSTTVGGYTITDASGTNLNEYFTATCSTEGLNSSADSIDGIKATATVSFISNNAFYAAPASTTVEVPLKAVAYTIINKKNTFYSSLDAAITAANATSSANVVVIPNLKESDGTTRYALTVNSAITLNSGVSLYLPYKDKNNYEQDCSVDNIDYDLEEGEILDYASVSTLADANATAVNTNRVTLVNLKNKLTISSGAKLYVGGVCGEKGVIGSYSELNLDKNASIDVDGELYCFGYVKENEENAINGIQANYKNDYKNENDGNRQISLGDGGYLKAALAVYDMKRSVSTLTNLDDNDVFPLSVFDLPNLQTYVAIEKGAELVSQTYLIGTTSSDKYTLKKEITLINSTSDDAVFHLTDKNMGLEYCPTDVRYTNITDITRVYLNGTIAQGNVKLSLPMSQEITSEGKFLPLSYKFNIFINDGATFNIGKQVKFLPGALLQNNPGGKIELSSELIFYDQDETSKISSYPKNKGNARLINNGKLTLTSTGKIGALIETTATDDQAQCDFSGCTSSAFAVSSKEGQYSDVVTRTSEGYFKSENGEKELFQFVTGKEAPITSVANENCWSGDKYKLRNLNISLDPNATFTTKLFSYQVYTAEDEEGTGKADQTGEVKTITGTNGDNISIAEGQYVKILVNRHKSATLNGKDLDSNKWYEVNSDMTLIIEPNKGVGIKLTTDGTSGNGKTTYTVLESSTKDGTYTSIWEGGTASGSNAKTIYVVEGWYYKVGVEDSGAAAAEAAAALGMEEGKNYTFLVPDEYTITPEGGNSSRFYVDTAYKAETASTINFPRKKKDNCVAEGTLVTLADGTQKAVENLTTDDILLVFNHETGKYEAAGITFIENDGVSTYNVINLHFDDGTHTRLIYEHALFDVTLNKYVYITESNYDEFIGHEFVVQDGDTYSTVTLINAYVARETTGCYSLVTVYHLNYFIDGLLSIPGGIEGLFNIFEYGEDLKFDEEKMQADIEKYGLYTYEDFKDYIPEEIYYAFPAPYLKVAVGKGLLTFDTILGYIEQFIVKNGLM